MSHALPLSRIWDFADRSGTCWLWLRAKDAKGYGFFSYNGRTIRAHRAAFLIDGGTLLPGQVLLHRCDTPSCINPIHLRPGSINENNRDRALKGRSACGERVATRLTVEAVRSIRSALADGRAKKAIAREHNVSDTMIRHIAYGRCWVSVPATLSETLRANRHVDCDCAQCAPP